MKSIAEVQRSITESEIADDVFTLFRSISRDRLGMVARLGPEESPIARFIAQGIDESTAWARYVEVFDACDASLEQASVRLLEARQKQILKLLKSKKLTPTDTRWLEAQMAHYRRSFAQRLEDLEKEVADAEDLSQTRVVQPGAAAENVASVAGQVRAARADLYYRAFETTVAPLSESGRSLTTLEQRLLVAYKRLRTTIGASWEGGWKDAFDFLASLDKRAVNQIRTQMKEVDALSTAIGDASTAGDQALVKQLTRRIDNAFSKVDAIRNKVKGSLGEAFAIRWSRWQTEKERIQRLAALVRRDLQKATGKKWEVISVAGDLFIDGLQCWDEAILVAERTPAGAVRQAKLVMAAQIKVAKRPNAIKQIANDIQREVASRRLMVQGQAFELTPLSPRYQTERWVLSAASGEFSNSQLRYLYRNRMEVKQLTLPLSLGDFNNISNSILRSFAMVK